MLPSDKSLPRINGAWFALFLACVLCAGCNRLATPPTKQALKDAEAKANSGDFMAAISLYEAALDGSERSADIHYRIALLYDDKMNDPLNALHHFKRYLALSPGGPKATEVKSYMKRDEIALLTTLSGDSLVTRAEAARLKNENLRLSQQLEERAAQLRNATAPVEKRRSGARAEKSPTPAKQRKGTPRA